MRPSGSTAVASVRTAAAPPIARLPRWTMCQSFANPSTLEYWHIGDTTMRFRKVTPRSASGEKRWDELAGDGDIQRLWRAGAEKERFVVPRGREAAHRMESTGAGRISIQMRRKEVDSRVVKGDRLGEFEEFALLAAFALGEGTYGVPIQQFIARTTGRDVSIGAVYAALGRLEAKGYVRSDLGPPSPQRGGRPKRLVEITPLGVRTVKNLRHVREHIWHVIEGDGRS